MATVTLGNLKFNWKGTYNAGTAYAIDDVVSYNGSSYVAKTATTGNLPTVTANWDLMSQKGTDGTDADLLSITSTAQGDIYYNSGSAIARLAKGTAAQQLAMNAGATAPEWITASSDCVKLAYLEGDAVNVTGVDVTGYFDDTKYHSYKFEISDLQFHASTNPQFSFLDSGGNQIDSNNFLVLNTGYISSSGSGNGVQNRAYWNTGAIQDLEGTWGNYQSAGDYDYASMQGTIYNPQSTSYGKKMDYQFNSMSIDGGIMVCANGSFYHHTNSAVNGFRVRGHSQNTRRYKLALYGMKK